MLAPITVVGNSKSSTEKTNPKSSEVPRDFRRLYLQRWQSSAKDAMQPFTRTSEVRSGLFTGVCRRLHWVLSLQCSYLKMIIHSRHAEQSWMPRHCFSSGVEEVTLLCSYLPQHWQSATSPESVLKIPWWSRLCQWVKTRNGRRGNHTPTLPVDKHWKIPPQNLLDVQQSRKGAV